VNASLKILLLVPILCAGEAGETGDQSGENTVNDTGCQVEVDAPECVCVVETFEITVTLTQHDDGKEAQEVAISVTGGAEFVLEDGKTTTKVLQTCPAEGSTVETYTVDPVSHGTMSIRVEDETVASVLRLRIRDIRLRNRGGDPLPKILACAAVGWECRADPSRRKPYTWDHTAGGEFDPNGTEESRITAWTAPDEPSSGEGEQELSVVYGPCETSIPMDIMIPCTASTEDSGVESNTASINRGKDDISLIDHQINYAVLDHLEGSIGTNSVIWGDRQLMLREDVGFTSPVPAVQRFLDAFPASRDWVPFPNNAENGHSRLRAVFRDGLVMGIDGALFYRGNELHPQVGQAFRNQEPIIELASHGWWVGIDQDEGEPKRQVKMTSHVYRVMVTAIRGNTFEVRVDYTLSFTDGCGGGGDGGGDGDSGE